MTVIIPVQIMLPDKIQYTQLNLNFILTMNFFFFLLFVAMIALNVFILKNYLANLASVSPELVSLMSKLIDF